MHYGATIEAKDPQLWTDENASQMQSLGMNLVRLQIHWRQQQPDQSQPIDFTESDAQVALAEKYQLLVVWPLQAIPTFALQPGATQVPQADALVAYAQAVFNQYGNRISAIEVGNEEWSFEHNKALKTPQNYESVFTPVANALRNAGYTGRIGMYGYTNYHATADIASWFQAFLALNPPLSYLNFHFYHHGQDPLTALPGKPSLPQIVQAIRSTGSQLPIWLTEFGFRTHCDKFHPAPCNEITPELQGEYLQKVLQALYDDNPRNHALVYTLCPGVQVMSIYQNSQPLPAAAVFKAWITSH
ncbi:MAG: hypothetical protein NVSMB33_14400 [Ktedonobacteraceae bacterium]